MYPDLQYLLNDLFNTEVPHLFSYLKTFGLFVALAFLSAAGLVKRELKRKELGGLLEPTLLPFTKAKKFTGRKEGFSSATTVPVYPHQRVGEIVLLALIGGLAGAKIFNALESWNEFVSDPIESLVSGSGLTFYGGLILATALIYYYCRRNRIVVSHLCDAVAPALMLAYAIGRLGCHFSGDGDWGIFNSAYSTLPDGSITTASAGSFHTSLASHASYFKASFDSLSVVPHAFAPAPVGLPTWLYAMNFPHNVNNEGILIENCVGTYCHVLPVPVFPTSLYEAIICMILFSILWGIRKRFTYALHLFGVYLILNGVERFLVEKIKVNYKYDWGFIRPAQSEIISIILIVAGTLILLFFRKRKTQNGYKAIDMNQNEESKAF